MKLWRYCCFLFNSPVTYILYPIGLLIFITEVTTTTRKMYSMKIYFRLLLVHNRLRHESKLVYHASLAQAQKNSAQSPQNWMRFFITLDIAMCRASTFFVNSIKAIGIYCRLGCNSQQNRITGLYSFNSCTMAYEHVQYLRHSYSEAL